MVEPSTHEVTTDAVVELLRRDPSTVFTVAGPGPDQLTLKPGTEPFSFDGGNLLVDVDLGLAVAEARERAQRAGVWLPMPDHPGTLLELLASAPGLVDAFVRDLDGLDREGARCASPTSPRAAVGPDLVGGALLPQLWMLPLRARVRVVSQAHARLTRLPMASAEACARTVVEAMDEGRAFILAATRGELRLTVGTSSMAEPPGAVRARQPLPAVDVTRGVLISGLDVDAITRRLSAGELLMGAPQQGRLLALDATPPAAVTFGPLVPTAVGLAAALTHDVEQRAVAHAPRTAGVKEPRHA